MAIALESYDNATLRLFLHRIRTHDLTAFLQHCTAEDKARLLGLLSPRSAAYLRDANWEKDTQLRVARAQALLRRCAANDDPCIFCSILAGTSPVSLVYRDDAIAAFMDLYPVTPGHVLIIPIAHAVSLEEVEPSVAQRIMGLGQRLGGAISVSDLGVDGFNLFLANGGAAGQDVFHVHLHVLPRFHGDGFGFRFPEHYPREAKRESLDGQAALFKELLTDQD